MPLSTDTLVRVAQADVALQMAFPSSIRHWEQDGEDAIRWKILPGDCDSLLIGKNDGIEIDGNCSNRVSAPDGGVIHICGDLTSTLECSGHYEIIVAGDVTDRATIKASGFCHVFVGGKLSGQLRSTDSAKVWIGSHVDGVLNTGVPFSAICIGGDLRGAIKPCKAAALLSLTVNGFASNATLLEIVKRHYTQFNASIGRSDVPPGIYSKNRLKTSNSRGGNSFNRWCVQAEHHA